MIAEVLNADYVFSAVMECCTGQHEGSYGHWTTASIFWMNFHRVWMLLLVISMYIFIHLDGSLHPFLIAMYLGARLIVCVITSEHSHGVIKILRNTSTINSSRSSFLLSIDVIK